MMLEPVRAAINAAISDNPAKLKGESIARRMLVSPSTLYGYGENGPDGDARKTIPLERFLQFTLLTEDGRPLSELCRLAGYAAIRLPERAVPGAEPAALKALYDFSKFMETHAHALLDNLVEADELADIEKRADAAQRAIAQVVALARQQREAGKRR
jgi:hypothetical protein